MGFDRAILAVGASKAVAMALEHLRPKGRLVVFSAVHDPAPVDLVDLHVRELEIVGACNDQDRLDQAIDILRDQATDLIKLVTHTFSLDQYDEALALAERGRDVAMKVAFTFAAEEQDQ